MAADLNLLVPELKSKVLTLQKNCSAFGPEMRANTGLRDPFVQGRLWRQSRSIEEIKSQIGQFKSQGAFFLAHCIESVGPQHGKHVTDTPPGISWHQWGEAIDFFWLVDGEAMWSTTKLIDGHNGYKVLADEAEKLGLTAGGHWNKFKDWPHIQLRKESNPAKLHLVKEIDTEMQKRFGNMNP